MGAYVAGEQAESWRLDAAAFGEPSDWLTQHRYILDSLTHPVGSLRDVQTPLSEVYRECALDQPSVSADERVLRGKPRITGTRIPVALVLRYLATGDGPVGDLGITPKDVSDCLEYAAMVCDYSTAEYE